MRRITLKFLCILICFFFTPNFSFCHDYYLGQLTIDHPYLVLPMPGIKSASGYLIIKNKGNKSDFLFEIETLFSEKVELHEMSMVGDIMKMKKINDGIEIPPGEEVVLKPGGLHIMFKNLKKNFVVGDKEKAILKFKKTGKIIVSFEIQQNKHSH